MTNQAGGPAPTVEELACQTLDHLGDRPRHLIGIVGAPGAGKSTFAERFAQALRPETSVIVPMDGFHLSTRLLTPEALTRRGAIDTFDGGGYLALLRRIAAGNEETVYAPAYQRGLEEPIAGAIAVPRWARIVITEGNYLLTDAPYWRDIRSLLDEVWLIETPAETRLSRLAARHASFGMDEASARQWAEGPDEANARLIGQTSHLADRVILWG